MKLKPVKRTKQGKLDKRVYSEVKKQKVVKARGYELNAEAINSLSNLLTAMMPIIKEVHKIQKRRRFWRRFSLF